MLVRTLCFWFQGPFGVIFLIQEGCNHAQWLPYLSVWCDRHPGSLSALLEFRVHVSGPWAQRRTKALIQNPNKLWIRDMRSSRGWDIELPLEAVWFLFTVGGLCRGSSGWEQGANAYGRTETLEDRGDDSEVKSTSCSFGGGGFKSQHSHGGSQLFVTPVPKTSPILQRFCTKVVHRHTKKTKHPFKLKKKKEPFSFPVKLN